MIQLTLKLDEKGELDTDAFSEDLYIGLSSNSLKEDFYDMLSELDCLLRMEELLINGPSKFILSIIDTINKYDAQKKKPHYSKTNMTEKEKLQQQACIKTRERIQLLLERISNGQR